MKCATGLVRACARTVRIGLSASFVLLALGPPAALAASSSALAQGYRTAGAASDIVAGALVSQKPGDPTTVELATADTASNLVGVAQASPLLVISGGGAEAQVVISGQAQALVSDINGPIRAGDKITASPLSGVGMVATADGQIVGAAQSDLNLTSAQTRSLRDSRGRGHTVHIGYVPVQLGVAYYQAPGSSFLPPFLQRLANNIAGRSVSAARILLAVALLIVAVISVSILIYSAVRSAMNSLGRNPLAASAIRKGLVQVMLVSVAVIGAALLVSYMVISL